MKHEWKIGDWCDLHGKRYFVFDRVKNTVWAIPKDGGNYVILFAVDDPDIKWLEGCDSWDWQPPKPIEPPEGYRLLTVGELIVADDLVLDQQWTPVHALSVGRQYDPACFYAIARKIQPQVRPMTRDEFLAAWKQRGFCPLIDPDNDYDFFERIIVDDCQDDQEFIQLMYAGWLGMDELTKFRFAFDKTFLTVEE